MVSNKPAFDGSPSANNTYDNAYLFNETSHNFEDSPANGIDIGLQVHSLCESCNQPITTGGFYRCKECGDFDICENCHENNYHNHDESHSFVHTELPTHIATSSVAQKDTNSIISSMKNDAAETEDIKKSSKKKV
jgi:hypothetical protein